MQAMLPSISPTRALVFDYSATHGESLKYTRPGIEDLLNGIFTSSCIESHQSSRLPRTAGTWCLFFTPAHSCWYADEDACRAEEECTSVILSLNLSRMKDENDLEAEDKRGSRW